MVELRLDQVAEKIKGEILQGSASLVFSKFNIDSRQTEPRELFFAIKAQRNGHDFVPAAFKKGASGAVISEEIPAPSKDLALVKVDDTLNALQELARQVLLDFKVPVIGITGSNGKTTAKEFTSSILGQKYQVLKSEGNYNNSLGLPLTLLKLAGRDKIAVLEMGMSKPGEIRTLTRIAPPDIAVITNINPVHLAFFNSVEEIALAKREILEGTKENGTAVLNGDDPLVKKISRDWKGKRIYFGLSPGCDLRAVNIRKNGFEGMTFDLVHRERREEVRFPFFYESFLYNLLAALGVAFSLSFSLEEIAPQIPKLTHFSMRGKLIRFEKNIKLVDDSYNSNPNALDQALRGLASLPARRKIAVLGDMLELGEKEAEYHFQAGKHAAQYGWDILVSVGPLSPHMVEGALSEGLRREQVFSFPDSEEAADAIPSIIKEGDFILVKGSRGMKMEKIVERLKKTLKRM